jgi:hypothetical protein
MLKRFTTHTLMALAEASLIALLVVGLIAGTAFAGRGGGSSLMWRMVTDADSNGALTHGDTITFDFSTSAAKPYVNVRCYQGTPLVYDGWVGYYAGAWFDTAFTLASNAWTSGGADCVARLVTYGKNGREQTQATKSFAVGS